MLIRDRFRFPLCFSFQYTDSFLSWPCRSITAIRELQIEFYLIYRDRLFYFLTISIDIFSRSHSISFGFLRIEIFANQRKDWKHDYGVINFTNQRLNLVTFESRIEAEVLNEFCLLFRSDAAVSYVWLQIPRLLFSYSCCWNFVFISLFVFVLIPIYFCYISKKSYLYPGICTDSFRRLILLVLFFL